MTLGPGNSQKWMAEAKWGDPEVGSKDPHTHHSARNGPKHTGKVAQDPPEGIGKAFPQKTDWSIIQSHKQTNKQSMNQPQAISHDWKPFL